MNTVTESQVNFIKRLQDERIPDTAASQGLEALRTLWKAQKATRQGASLVIDFLLACPVREAAPVIEEVSIEGMHRLDGKIYKVQVAVHGSGRPYAKVLVTDLVGTCGGCEKCDGEDRCPVYESRFDYAAGVVRRLSLETRLSLDEAKEFGAVYGVCCVCSRTLTNEDSIEAGIGPVCAGKF